MRYAQIRTSDVANGAGIRTSLYIQGCSKRCKGCFNPQTWSFEGGQLWTSDIEDAFISLIGKPHIVGTTILGGEPMEEVNRPELLKLLKRIRNSYPNKNIWMYTSYLYEDLLEECAEIVSLIDVIIDGEFVEELKDLRLQFRGSSNQRVICVKESMLENEIILYNSNN